MQAYDIVLHDGKTVDRLTQAALLEAERRLGYPLTIVQGSYNRGVGASAGTHDGGGAVDLAPWDWQNKVRTLRSIGFAAWYRPAIAGLWGAHIHAVLIGNERLSASAHRQVQAYYAGRNGLANNGPDDFWRPSPIPVFRWAPERDTRGRNIDSALAHLANVKARPGSQRERLVADAVTALRSIKAKKTTTPYTHGMSHKRKPSVSRGFEVDAALKHIRRAARLAGPTRRKALNAARVALLGVKEVK